MAIFFSIIMGMLATGVILGLGYLFYEAVQAPDQPPPAKVGITPPVTLRFKKPNL